MKDELEKGNGAQNYADFSPEEREQLRLRVSLFMRSHPARAPFWIRTLDRFSTALWIFAAPARAPRAQFAFALVVLVLVAGVGTSYAAESALPGDPLYSIKTNVTEPIEGALATSPEAKANWNANLAATRLSEAETLAAQGKLTPSTESTLASGLDQATNDFDASVASLSNSSANAATVADLESNMEATLAAHGQVLQELAEVLPQTSSAIMPLIARVQTRALALGNARSETTDVAVSASTTSTVKAAAEAQKTSAEGELSAARALVGSVSATSSGGVASETFDAEQEIGAGNVRLEQGQYGAALQTFQTASVDAQEAQLHVDIADQLKQATGISLPLSTSTAATSSLPVSEATSTSATSTSATSTAATSTTKQDEGGQVKI